MPILLAACAPAATPPAELGTRSLESKLVDAYPTDERAGMRARVVCEVADSAPTRWSDVFIGGDATVEACELVIRGECEGNGDVVRPCSHDPLPVALVPRGVIIGRQELAQVVRYGTFAARAECEAQGKSESVEARIESLTLLRDAAVRAVRDAERRLASARAAEAANVPLLQLDLERLREMRDDVERRVADLRAGKEESGEAARRAPRIRQPITCVRAGGS